MKFAVTVISPPGYVHSLAFKEVAESIHYGLISLGYDSVLTHESMLPERQHIILGANLLPYYPLPLADNAILYNLEQVYKESPWLTPPLIEIFRHYTVWDYSEQNVAAFGDMGINVAQILPIGYTKELTRIQHVTKPDIDVLLVGSINERRSAVINQMNQQGIRAHAIFGAYGDERDALIARSKLLLNVHFYDAKVLETVRISYLLANKCAVLSEYSANPAEDAEFAEGVAFTEYQNLAERARYLLDNPDELERLAQRGFELIRQRSIADYLRSALAKSGSD